MNAFPMFSDCAINQYRAMPEHIRRQQDMVLAFGAPVGFHEPSRILWWALDEKGHALPLISLKGDGWMVVYEN